MDNLITLANGGELNKRSWDDFVNRLKYHCEGDGVKEHCTSYPIFEVQEKTINTGMDREFTNDWVIIDEEVFFYSPEELYIDLDDEQTQELNADGDFLSLPEKEQWEILEHAGYIVTGYVTEWVTINQHLTKEAAEAFIKRKGHDYEELRIVAESLYWCNEFKAIQKAILDGRLQFIEGGQDE